jgi:hypothetical protein
MKTISLAVIAIILALTLALNPIKLLPLDESSLFFVVIGVTYGVMSAFAINDVDKALDELRDSFDLEVSSLKSVYLLSKGLSDKSAYKKIAKSIKEYCTETISLNLEAYAQGNEAHKKFHSLLWLLSAIKVRGARDNAIFGAIIDEAKLASTSRDRQITLAKDRLPLIQWILELFLSVLLVLILAITTLPYSAASLVVVFLMVSAILLTLIVIYELDTMSDFEDEISNEPYRKLILLMDDDSD